MAEKNDTEAITRRLDAVIGLLLENMVVSGLIGKGRSVEILYKAGLTPTEIGNILGVPATNIGAIIAQQKKRRGARKRF
ncbi:MAG: hypothetical protein KGI27_02220 [Thaumarchaeota archaeon]|nr:hypothetical protein [Nitrososphaerota archaeon]